MQIQNFLILHMHHYNQLAKPRKPNMVTTATKNLTYTLHSDRMTGSLNIDGFQKLQTQNHKFNCLMALSSTTIGAKALFLLVSVI